MNRLTKKIDTLKYVPTTEKLVSIDEIIYKLGKLEDLLEKYDINSVKKLETLIKGYQRIEKENLELNIDLGACQKENEMLTKDIEKYWKIQEELGCPLEVVIETLKQGYIYVYDNHYNYDDYTKTKAKITFNNNKFYIGFARNTRRLEDYQKTWWLKGEKDE